jgi:hypothetical protein
MSTFYHFAPAENSMIEFVDTHWAGGDPRWLQVYGWAAWWPNAGADSLTRPAREAGANLLN